MILISTQVYGYHGIKRSYKYIKSRTRINIRRKTLTFHDRINVSITKDNIYSAFIETDFSNQYAILYVTKDLNANRKKDEMEATSIN